MAQKNNFIVGLDLGSVKTAALVCTPNPEGKLEIMGLGVAESRGWRKGLIVNLDLTVMAVKKAIEAAETAAKISIGSAFVGVAGAHIKGVNSSGAVTLEDLPVRRVESSARIWRGLSRPRRASAFPRTASFCKFFRKNSYSITRTASGYRWGWKGRAWK